ncbi:MAG: type III-B CRISPR module RAMP protein Cmr1 [Ktedonobacteraceae bacterium]
MQEVTFTLRVLTPLFLTGADQTTAELRAPSFRGLMRYWYRALVGGIVGADGKTLQQVMKAETTVFGATDTGSAVAVRVFGVSEKPKEFTERTSINVGGKWQATGKGYLLWSMARNGSNERRNLKPARWFFPPGTTFRLTLSAHGEDDIKLKQAIAAFWLLINLGSVGSRSRRCAGSIAVSQPVENHDTDLSFETPADVEGLRRKLQQGIAVARSLYTRSPSQTKEDASFDALSRNTSRICILQNGQRPWPTSEGAMEDIGESLQAYRASVVPLWKRSIFGLPLKDVDNRARRASPLLLRVVELQNKQYVGIAVLFKTISKDVATKDYALIEQWIATFPGKVEVTL